MKAIKNDFNYMTASQEPEISISDVPFSILLNDLFVQRCLRFYSFDALVYHCDYAINTKDAFLALPTDTLDSYISDHTAYDSWEEMFADAVAAYVERNLGKQ